MVSRLYEIVDRFGIWLILLFASLVRLWNLGNPHSLVFDETYYVKDAYSMLSAGHELQWPDGADQGFASGSIPAPLNSPEFVVHSPLGKWLISLGMLAFGKGNPFGWRIVPAIFGILLVWLVYLVSIRIINSKRWALVPAFLIAIDGQAIVLSRTAILDGLVTVFALLGFYFLLRALEKPIESKWLILMSLTLGFGGGVKWNSFFFLAVFLLYFLFVNRFKSFWLAAGSGVLALIAYLTTWTGWFATQGWGFNRSNILKSFIEYQLQIYHFHSTLVQYHPYRANASTWLVMFRPTSFYWQPNGNMVSNIDPIGNPVFWWGGLIALGLAVSWWIRERDQQTLLVLTGYIAGYFPWLLMLSRTAFQFYSVTFEPWVAITFALMAYRYRAKRVTLLALGLAFLVALYFLPLYTATPITDEFWRTHMWLPSWI